MKTTLDLPDELMREIKVRAAREDRKLKDLIAELLRQGLTTGTSRETSLNKRHHVKVPLIDVPRAAPAGQELTPDRIHEILLEDEVRWALGQ